MSQTATRFYAQLPHTLRLPFGNPALARQCSCVPGIRSKRGCPGRDAASAASTLVACRLVSAHCSLRRVVCVACRCRIRCRRPFVSFLVFAPKHELFAIATSVGCAPKWALAAGPGTARHVQHAMKREFAHGALWAPGGLLPLDAHPRSGTEYFWTQCQQVAHTNTRPPGRRRVRARLPPCVARAVPRPGRRRRAAVRLLPFDAHSRSSACYFTRPPPGIATGCCVASGDANGAP